MKLPRVYEYYVTGQILRFEQLGEDLQLHGNSLRKRISELTSRGYLLPIRQGLYILNSPAAPILNQTQPQVKILFDMPSHLEIGSALSKSSTIGYLTALYQWSGITPPEAVPVIVISRTKFNSFNFRGRTFAWCQDSSSLSQTQTFIRPGNPNPYRITSLEQTLIDCLKRPKYAPSWHTILEICEHLPPPEPRRLAALLRVTDSAALNSRLGLLLEWFQSQWFIPTELISELQLRRSRKEQAWHTSPNSKSPGDEQTNGWTEKAGATVDKNYNHLFRRWNVWPESDPSNFNGSDSISSSQTS